VADSVVCGLCNPVSRVIYPTLRALHLEQVIHAFAEWITATPVPAQALGLGRRSGGGKWATVLPADDDKGYEIIIPLAECCRCTASAQPPQCLGTPPPPAALACA